jgi:hypothetical protein
MARVVEPKALARDILEEVEAARERYTPALPFPYPGSSRPRPFEPLKMTLEDAQPRLASTRS